MNSEATNICPLLDAYLDGELPTDQREAFNAHLDQCAACREAIEEQRWIDGLLQSQAAVEHQIKTFCPLKGESARTKAPF